MTGNWRRVSVLAATTVATMAAMAPTAQAADSPTPQELLDRCGSADLCVFHPESRDAFPGERRQVGNQVLNCSNVNQNEMVAWSDETGGSNSLGITISAEMKFAEVYSVSVSTTYQHTWNWSHTETRTDNMTVQPWHIGEVFHTPQMQRVRGTYELHFGKRFYGHYFWYVPFEAVGPIEDSSQSVTFFTRPMTPEERAQCPTGLAASHPHRFGPE
ncbi:hypothetical protein [Gandjariella thermophila]|uniref:Uncharacterized protein n=1 Tax=Gandjariella thermophila TaxID=1931992 RepID=A0A4D4JBD2_9PSEU|nr:hypothetical protein [Gandjariella thermophila]GDY32874.1 hypothetical protein GTS_45070 [Gandjariella thermophila]